jgi:hypothetical protein
MRHGMDQQRDPLSGESMQVFLAGLAGLAPEEISKAKALYVKNAISEYRAAVESLNAMGCIWVVFYIIPLFWPFIIMQKRTMRAGKRLMRERIENAMDVWGDDIRASGITIDLDDLEF